MTTTKTSQPDTPNTPNKPNTPARLLRLFDSLPCCVCGKPAFFSHVHPAPDSTSGEWVVKPICNACRPFNACLKHDESAPTDSTSTSTSTSETRQPETP